MKHRLRPAFTLIELLIVLAILGLLLGLLLPAIAKVYQARDRMVSQVNLKQIALACHNYLDNHRNFPPGRDEKGFSAQAKLLPYLEQANLYDRIDFQASPMAKVNAPVANTRIPTYQSPRDTLAKGGEWASSSYLFNAGTNYELEKNNGVFYQDSKIGVRDLKDGFSNTIMVGETLIGDGSEKATTVKRQHVLLDTNALAKLNDDSGVQDFQNNKNIAGNRGHHWISGDFLQTTFTGTRKLNDGRPDVDCDGLGGLSGLRSLDKGTNLAICDGSVRFVENTIGLKTWKAACTRAGGEPLGLDW